MPVRLTIDGKTYEMEEDAAFALAKQRVVSYDQIEKGRFFREGETEMRTASSDVRLPPPADPLKGKIPSARPVLDALNRGLSHLAPMIPTDAPPSPPGVGPAGTPLANPPQLSPGVTRMVLEALLGGLGVAGGTALGGPGVGSTIGGEIGGQIAGSLLAETIDPTESPLKTAATTGLAAAASGGAGAAINRARRGPSGLAADADAISADLRAMAIAKRTGKPVKGLTAGQMTDSRWVDFMDSVAETSIFGRPIMQRAKEGTARAAQEEIGDLAVALGRSGPEIVGKAIEEAAGNGRTAWLSTTDALYKRAFGAVQGGEAFLSGRVRQRARQLAEQHRVRTPGIQKFVDEIEDKIEKAGGTGAIPLEEAKELRSSWLKINRNAVGDVFTEVDEKVAGELSELLSDQIDKGFMRTDPSGIALKQKQRADRYFKAGAKRFNKDLIGALAKRDPEQLYKYAIVNNSPTQIREIRNAVMKRSTTTGSRIDPEGLKAWQDVQGRLLYDIMMDSGLAESVIITPGVTAREAMRKGGIINPKRVSDKMKSIGDNALKEIFTPSQLRTVRENLDIVAKVTAAPGKGEEVGAMALSLRQAGAAGGTLALIMSGQFVEAAGLATGYLLAPIPLAKLMTDPRTKNWFVVGLRAKPGTDTAIRAATRIGELALLHGATPIHSEREQFPQSARDPRQFHGSTTLGGPRGREVTR